MLFPGDERGQAIAIGGILLFGMVLVAFAGYQSFVVPDQNSQTEYAANQQTQEQLQTLRNTVLTLTNGGNARSVPVVLGVEYPDRLVARNPGDVTGSLRTEGTTDPAVNVSIANASASEETGDFWNGSYHNYTTGNLVYEGAYNRYTDAPRTIYDNGVLYNEFADENQTIAGQPLLSDTQIRIPTLNGSLSVTRTGRSSVDLVPISASGETVAIDDDRGRKVTIAIPTGLPESTWRDLLDGQFDDQGGHIANLWTEPIPGTPFDHLHLSLEESESYELSMSRIGIGGTGKDTEATYLTAYEGNGTTITEGSATQVAVQARDRFNNPVKGATVEADVHNSSKGGLGTTALETNSDGVARFTFQSAEVDNVAATLVDVNLSLVDQPDVGFDPETAANASVTVEVQNTDGSGTKTDPNTYDLKWLDPSSASGTLTPCDNETCQIDPGASSVTLTTGTDPDVKGATINYAINDTDHGTVTSPGTTSSNGESTTDFSPGNAGLASIYAWSGTEADEIQVVMGEVAPSIDTFQMDDYSQIGCLGLCVYYYFDIWWDVSDANGNIDNAEVWVNVTGGSSTKISDGEIDRSGDVTVEVTDGQDYVVRLFVEDSAGNRLCKQFDATANQDDSDDTKSSC